MEQAKRGRPRKVQTVKPAIEIAGAMTVLVAGAISDGEGGWLPIGTKTVPTDETARASLIAKGLAE
jgi:hypothetical protein